MKKITLLSAFYFLFFSPLMAQLMLSDYIDLGEDRSSHNYQEYGSSISLSFYACNGDSAITVGSNNQNDSIVFDLSVTPNSNDIMIRWGYAWFNSGSANDQFTKIVLENTFEDTLASPGPNAIGSHFISCDLDSHQVIFNNVAAYTADGTVKVKIYDPYAGFSGNSSITRVEVYSDIDTAFSIEENKYELASYPNPFTDEIFISTNGLLAEDLQVQIVDMFGRIYPVQLLESNSNQLIIDSRTFKTGVYFISLIDARGNVLSRQKIVKR